MLGGPEAELEDRDLLIGKFFEDAAGELGEAPVSLEETAGLREAFDVPEGGFALVLVGKDGGEKFRAHEPVRAREVFDLIDAMPMRRREMGRKD